MMFAITARLLLRPAWPEDAPASAGLFGEAAARAWRATATGGNDAADRPGMEPGSLCRPQLLIFRRDSAALIGMIGLIGDDWPELIFRIAPAHRARGFATEAGQAMIDSADSSLRVPRLIARHAADDRAAARVLAKLGFRDGGVADRLMPGRPPALRLLLRDRADRAAARRPIAA